jgi:hypothetical protein
MTNSDKLQTFYSSMYYMASHNTHNEVLTNINSGLRRHITIREQRGTFDPRLTDMVACRQGYFSPRCRPAALPRFVGNIGTVEDLSIGFLGGGFRGSLGTVRRRVGRQ